MLKLRAACVALLVVVPSAAFAQASITGVVKDTSGAVLPGVTVEASSPVLIEKVRTAVADGTGQYRIIDLRPGTYSVTFTLTGFSTVKREGIELTGRYGRRSTPTCGRHARGDDHRHRRDADRGRAERAAPGDHQRRHHHRDSSARAYGAIMTLIPRSSSGERHGARDVQVTPAMVGVRRRGGRENEGRLQVDGINTGARSTAAASRATSST